MNSNNVQLRLLAQINFSEMPLMENFPQSGILQFFLNDNDENYLFGADLKQWTNQENFRVVYHENIDNTVTEEKIISKLKISTCPKRFPVENVEKRIYFNHLKEGITLEDYKFEKLFVQLFNEEFEENQIENIFDLEDIDEDVYEEVFDDEEIEELYNDKRSKMGGYLGTYQGDPRKNDEDKELDILLFQCGTGINREDIWNDGIGNFFITKKDLESKNFSRVGYNYDR